MTHEEQVQHDIYYLRRLERARKREVPAVIAASVAFSDLDDDTMDQLLDALERR